MLAKERRPLPSGKVRADVIRCWQTVLRPSVEIPVFVQLAHQFFDDADSGLVFHAVSLPATREEAITCLRCYKEMLPQLALLVF